jgi:hypothetical protein
MWCGGNEVKPRVRWAIQALHESECDCAQRRRARGIHSALQSPTRKPFNLVHRQWRARRWPKVISRELRVEVRSSCPVRLFGPDDRRVIRRGRGHGGSVIGPVHAALRLNRPAAWRKSDGGHHYSRRVRCGVQREGMKGSKDEGSKAEGCCRLRSVLRRVCVTAPDRAGGPCGRQGCGQRGQERGAKRN